MGLFGAPEVQQGGGVLLPISANATSNPALAPAVIATPSVNQVIDGLRGELQNGNLSDDEKTSILTILALCEQRGMTDAGKRELLSLASRYEALIRRLEVRADKADALTKTAGAAYQAEKSAELSLLQKIDALEEINSILQSATPGFKPIPTKFDGTPGFQTTPVVAGKLDGQPDGKLTTVADENALKAQNSALQAEVVRLSKENSEHTDDLSALQSAQNTVTDLQSAVSNLTTALASKENDLNALKAQIGDLNGNLAVEVQNNHILLAGSAVTIKQMQDSLTANTNALNAANATIENLQSQVASVTSDRDSTAAQLAQTQQSLSQIKERVANYQAIIETIKGKLGGVDTTATTAAPTARSPIGPEGFSIEVAESLVKSVVTSLNSYTHDQPTDLSDTLSKLSPELAKQAADLHGRNYSAIDNRQLVQELNVSTVFAPDPPPQREGAFRVEGKIYVYKGSTDAMARPAATFSYTAMVRVAMAPMVPGGYQVTSLDESVQPMPVSENPPTVAAE